MKNVLFLFAAVLVTGTAFGDVIMPLTNGVECVKVRGTRAGGPDLTTYNQQLNRRKQAKDTELKSVSVSPLPTGEYLVCTTASGENQPE